MKLKKEDYLWGIDLGGSKVEGVILKQGNVPEPVVRLRLPTNAEKGYDFMLAQVLKLIETLKNKSSLNPFKIGIGTPGIIDTHTGLMKNCNSLCLNGRNLKADLEERLQIPMLFANDANCFALAETRFGIVRDVLPGAKVVFGVIMGTGVGGGIIVNGKVWNGRQGIAGEWGHNILVENGEPCYCGKKGCVEQVISGPALERYYHKLSNRSKTLTEIVRLDKEGSDIHARLTIDRLVTMFSKAISTVINILDPDAIVIGGGVGNIDLLYSEGLKEIKKYIFNNRIDTLILKPKIGDSAGVFGAASLVE